MFFVSSFVGYGLSENTILPCFGVSGRAVGVSTCPRSEYKSAQLNILIPKSSPKLMSFVCKASTGGHRRNPDFSRQNRSGFSRNKNRSNEQKDNYDNLDESEFLSTKNGPLLSLSNSPKSHATPAPGPREREIVELFRKVQAQLRQRAATKEEKKFESHKGQTKESETVDSLLKLLRKHSVEQGKRKVNGDHPRQSGQSTEDKSKDFFNSSSFVREEPQETNKPSFSRPPSAFRRRSPVPRIKYEPVVSSLDLNVKTDDNLPKPHHEPESDFDMEPDMDLVSGLAFEQEEEREEEAERESEMESDFVDESAVDTLSQANFLHSEEEEDSEVKNTEGEHTELKDLNALKLSELRAIAKARGMKGFSKLKKSELVGLLSEDSI